MIDLMHKQKNTVSVVQVIRGNELYHLILQVMENDVCEPYCLYAHIYTALEKIFATLRQVDKYRLYLDLLVSYPCTKTFNKQNCSKLK